MTGRPRAASTGRPRRAATRSPGGGRSPCRSACTRTAGRSRYCTRSRTPWSTSTPRRSDTRRAAPVFSRYSEPPRPEEGLGATGGSSGHPRRTALGRLSIGCRRCLPNAWRHYYCVPIRNSIGSESEPRDRSRRLMVWSSSVSTRCDRRARRPGRAVRPGVRRVAGGARWRSSASSAISTGRTGSSGPRVPRHGAPPASPGGLLRGTGLAGPRAGRQRHHARQRRRSAPPARDARVGLRSATARRGTADPDRTSLPCAPGPSRIRSSTRSCRRSPGRARRRWGSSSRNRVRTPSLLPVRTGEHGGVGPAVPCRHRPPHATLRPR